MNDLKLIFLIFLFLISSCKDTDKISRLHVEGMQFFQLNKRELSKKKFQELYSIDPDYLDTRIMLGKLHYFDLEFEKANFYFQEAYEKENSNLNALMWVIKSNFVSGKKAEEVLEMTKLYLSMDSANPEILYIRGKLLENIGKIDEAILSYTKATQNVNFVALSYLQLGLIFKKADLKEKFEENLRKAKKISEDDPVLSKEINRHLSEIKPN
ncbi:hypothetical protein EHQ43_01510 [Leptospira bouyouniensis]|uniref:Uncharacterized protein n=1 Tax=Leptospira bouyouniensis TaxID=2484911 RepID=A0A7I0HX93_9LEPT|nr:hypothetical protein [Leptospira bouyouniensis]TGL09160.1 hypothetical protein EHQ43_01510 [Leptospira bouyouniensis]